MVWEVKKLKEMGLGVTPERLAIVEMIMIFLRTNLKKIAGHSIEAMRLNLKGVCKNCTKR